METVVALCAKLAKMPKTFTTVERSNYDEICDKFPDMFLKPTMLPIQPI